MAKIIRVKKRLYSSGVCVLSVYTLFVCVEKGKHQSQRYVMVYDRIEEEEEFCIFGYRET